MRNVSRIVLFAAVGLQIGTAPAAGLRIDHTCTNLARVPESAILEAKARLHIAYGHTSHGSQIVDGMSGLVGFANGGGKGFSFSRDLFAWNDGGTGGALDLHDGAMGGDAGYFPDWVDNTRAYLGAPTSGTGRGSNQPDVNVILWSWCGQVSGKWASGTLDAEYLSPMTQLERDYPGITFVYMTGHVDHWDDANNKGANNAIRDYCAARGATLYDFADIESWDPDGRFYEYPSDNCDYYASESGDLLGNWAVSWQQSHPVGTEWYDCGAAHSESLNANQKAYAAWWMFARLAGWDPGTAVAPDAGPSGFGLEPNYPNPFNPGTRIRFELGLRSEVRLGVHSLDGRLVREVLRGPLEPGRHSAAWDGTTSAGLPAASGIYLLRLEASGRVSTRRMTLAR